MGLMWLALTACAPRQPQGIRASDVETLTYELSLQASFVTRGEDGLEVSLPDQALSLVGHAQLTPAALYRDGSLGTVLTLQGLHDPETGAAHGLSGRAVALRTFESGEVLEVSGLDHLAGPGRHGDALDVLIPLLSPRLPLDVDGGPVKLVTSYPVRIDATRGHKVEVAAAWSAAAGRGAKTRHYEGQLRCQGQEQALALSCAGAVTGDTEQDREGRLAAHALHWTRTLVLQGPGGTLVQEQVFDAAIRRAPEAP